MKITTIGRNRVKYIESLFAKAIECKCYTLDNGFSGVSVSVDVIRRALFDSVIPGKLTHADDRDTYSVRIHSNRWYEFKVAKDAPAEVHPACCGCSDCEKRYAA